MRVSALMSPELGIIVLACFWRRDEIPFLTDVVSAAHADKPAFFQIVFLFRAQGDGVDEHGQIVCIAAHDLDELVFTLDQSPVVDAPRIHLAESVLTALSDEPAAVISVLVVELLFVIVTDRFAVYNYAGALDGFLC